MSARHVPRQGHSRSTHGRVVRPSHSHDSFDVPIVANQAYYEQVQVDLGEQITSQNIAPGAIGPGMIQDGTIQDLTPFADDIRPVVIVDSLPTLPDTDYPEFSYVVLTTDERLYKNIADVWVLGVDGADIVADSITAGQIAAGAISASEISAGAITTEKLGLVDSGGVTLLSAAGFGPTWRRFIQSGLYNSDFYSPPPIEGQVLTPSNELPYWSYVQASGTKITAQSITDADAASGRVVRFVMATAGAAGDKTYIEQYVAISGSRSQRQHYIIDATVGATTDGLAEMFLEVAEVDGALAQVGIGTISSFHTLTTLNADPDNVLGINLTDNYGHPTASDAAFLRIRVGMRRGSAGVNDTGTGYVMEVQVTRQPSEIWLSDLGNPAGKEGGRIFASDGLLHFYSQHGEAGEARLWLDGDSSEVVTPGAFHALQYLGYNGGDPLIQTGSGSFTMDGSGAFNASVNFARSFANTPIVICQRNTGSGGAPKVHVWATGGTTSGFTVNGATGDGTASSANVGYRYIAIDPTFFG